MKRNRSWLFLLAGMLGFLTGAWIAKAQGPGDNVMVVGPGPGPEGGPGFMWQRRIGPPGGPEDITFAFVAAEGSFERQTVKGAPYSADSVTETVQTLADGNKITRQLKATVYRDSEGRVRREQTLPAIGPFAAAGEPALTVFINDPVAGVNYVLEPGNKVARKMTLPRREEGPFTRPAPPPARRKLDAKTESLGERLVEGVRAQGTRTSVTIPAGEVGNEKPLVMTNERWFSPELQVVVMSSRSDPRMGQTTYRLTNVNRSEPQKLLFEVPSDYSLQDMPRGPRGPGMMRRGGAPRN